MNQTFKQLIKNKYINKKRLEHNRANYKASCKGKVCAPEFYRQSCVLEQRAVERGFQKTPKEFS